MKLDLQIFGPVSGEQWEALSRHTGKPSARATEQPLVFTSITNFPTQGPTTKVVVLASDLAEIDIVRIATWLNSLPFGDSVQMSWSPRAPNVLELSEARRQTG